LTADFRGLFQYLDLHLGFEQTSGSLSLRGCQECPHRVQVNVGSFIPIGRHSMVHISIEATLHRGNWCQNMLPAQLPDPGQNEHDLLGRALHTAADARSEPWLHPGTLIQNMFYWTRPCNRVICHVIPRPSSHLWPDPITHRARWSSIMEHCRNY